MVAGLLVERILSFIGVLRWGVRAAGGAVVFWCWAPATVPVTMRAMAGAGLQQALRLVGREAECAAVDRLLEDARVGVGGLRRSRGLAPRRRYSVGSRPASCLSFCLIHSRSGPFTDVHPARVWAGRERWRTPVNAGQHCWKACWGQPLRSSNLLSSATLTCKNIGE
jgi:hypothetical protein